MELGLLDELAADIFALMVFLCDGLLKLKAIPTTPAAAGTPPRFFVIASNMPMELQMVLCHRVVGSMEQNILSVDSEAAFKSLARILLLSQSK